MRWVLVAELVPHQELDARADGDGDSANGVCANLVLIIGEGDGLIVRLRLGFLAKNRTSRMAMA